MIRLRLGLPLKSCPYLASLPSCPISPALYCFLPGSHSLIFPMHIDPPLQVASGKPELRHSGKHLPRSGSVCLWPLREPLERRIEWEGWGSSASFAINQPSAFGYICNHISHPHDMVAMWEIWMRVTLKANSTNTDKAKMQLLHLRELISFCS